MRCAADGSAIYMNNTLCNSNQGAQGGCVAANNATQLAIVNTQMLSNTAENGGGIYISSCTELVVYNVTMRNNTASVNGGGIFQVGALGLFNCH